MCEINNVGRRGLEKHLLAIEAEGKGRDGMSDIGGVVCKPKVCHAGAYARDIQFGCFGAPFSLIIYFR